MDTYVKISALVLNIHVMSILLLCVKAMTLFSISQVIKELRRCMYIPNNIFISLLFLIFHYSFPPSSIESKFFLFKDAAFTCGLKCVYILIYFFPVILTNLHFLLYYISIFFSYTFCLLYHCVGLNINGPHREWPCCSICPFVRESVSFGMALRSHLFKSGPV